MKAAAGQELQLAAGLGKQVHQHSAVRAAADLLGDLIDEALRPMSHLGSI